MYPALFAEEAEAGRQKEQRRQEEEKEKKKLKAVAKERRAQYLQEEERTAQLFGEYERIIDGLDQDQLVEILKGMGHAGGTINQQSPHEVEKDIMIRLKAMVRYNAHKLKESESLMNRGLWKKYFSGVMKTSSPVMETSSPTPPERQAGREWLAQANVDSERERSLYEMTEAARERERLERAERERAERERSLYEMTEAARERERLERAEREAERDRVHTTTFQNPLAV